MTELVLFAIGMICAVGAIIIVFSPRKSRQRLSPSRVRAPIGTSEIDPTEASVETIQPLSETEILSLYHALALGVDQLDTRIPPNLVQMSRAIDEAVKARAGDPQFASRRPSLLPQLVHAMNDSDTPRRELGRIIAQDPALVGNLLKIANSALYRIDSRPVESLDRAIAILGVSGIRSLVAAALMQPMFLSGNGPFESFPRIAWEQSFRTAAAAEAHAAFIESTDRLAAQLLGLITGLGAIVVFRIALDCFARKSIQPHPAVIAAALKAHAASTARKIAAEWDLSPRVLEALESEALHLEPEAMPALGRSLHFGRLTATLAVLQTYNVLDDTIAKACLPRPATAAFNIDRIWTRLCAQHNPGDPARAAAA